MGYFLHGQETERLVFRKLVPTDFDAWLPFHQDIRSTQYWLGGHSNPIQACEAWFKNISSPLPK